MKFNKRPRGRGASPPADPLFAQFAEALSNPRGRPGGRAAAEDRKAKQLCRQAFQAISLTLAGECGDDLLRDLTVQSVEPAAGSSRLLVRVVIPPPDPSRPAATPWEVMARLSRHHAQLRAAVARSATRKRTPELTFLPVASDEWKEVIS